MAKAIHYFEHYPHYLGTKNSELRFTPKEFDTLIGMSKAAIKEEKDSGGAEDGPAVTAFDEHLEAIEKKQKANVSALEEALVDYYDSPKRPAAIATAIKKKGLWSGEWEEGSFAFATTAKKAKDACAKIEAKHAMDDF